MVLFRGGVMWSRDIPWSDVCLWLAENEAKAKVALWQGYDWRCPPLISSLFTLCGSLM